MTAFQAAAAGGAEATMLAWCSDTRDPVVVEDLPDCGTLVAERAVELASQIIVAVSPANADRDVEDEGDALVRIRRDGRQGQPGVMPAREVARLGTPGRGHVDVATHQSLQELERRIGSGVVPVD